jgi:Fe-S-cluster containining protein
MSGPNDFDPIELERGLRFMHTLGMQSKIDLVDCSERLMALIESLIASGTLDLRDFETRRARVAQREGERMDREGHVHVALNDVQDKYVLDDLPEIDCAARLPLCKARCCALSFPLSVQDLDEHKVQWDYGRPYQIRQRQDGYCVHNGEGDHRCGVYEQRPAVCRTYDCREDSRIWKDFEARIIADDLAAADET